MPRRRNGIAVCIDGVAPDATAVVFRHQHALAGEEGGAERDVDEPLRAASRTASVQRGVQSGAAEVVAPAAVRGQRDGIEPIAVIADNLELTGSVVVAGDEVRSAHRGRDPERRQPDCLVIADVARWQYFTHVVSGKL